MVPLGSGLKRNVRDYIACCLIAQNADPKKEEVAFAQSYFAVQTRKQELMEERFGRIRFKGDTALLGGYTTQDMKRKLGAKENRRTGGKTPC